ncbi:hypothetical protein AT05_10865 [Schleiferia thermophila str. Yellowstone]|jgi:hypothetical protein|nr:hypothetical protein AT05_10865 [Schleiferia thermophila str. Yellowstone]
MIIQYFSTFFESKYLFYVTLLINVLLLFSTKFYPSMDGPAHLYNANILLHLLRGNDFLSEFYSINNLPIPNWISHIILLIFQSFLPSWMAEKILLIIYVSGMALSFRYLIKVLNPKNISLSILIFPFIYSFLFHLGFYNFSLSFILFFSTLGYWIHSFNSKNKYKYFILFLLITMTYFTNLLIFGFLGLTMGLYVLYFSVKKYLDDHDMLSALRFCSRNLLILLLISLPGLIFFLIFYVNVQFYPSEEAYSVKELIKWINDARPFIVFDYADEEIITEQFLHVLLLLLGTSFLLNNEEKSNYNNIEKANVIAIPLLLSIFLYFVTPNGSSAGMMSDRYCLILYMLGLVWVVSRSVATKFNGILIFSILILHFGLLFKHLNDTIKKLDANAIAINMADEYISENSIVLPVNLSDHWLETHFSNYLGVDKPMVILENYEASVNWFPIKWNSEKIPNILLKDKNSISEIQWINNINSTSTKQIDYVLLYGNLNKINDPKWSDLKEQLSAGFKVKYISENHYVALYEKI